MWLQDFLGLSVYHMKELRIRAFQHSDLESYAHILWLTLPCDDLEEARENANIIMERVKEEKRELWVAIVENTQVGFMLLDFEEETLNVEIDWFDIHPDYQRHGVGTALVLKAEERTNALNHRTVTLHTAKSNHKMRKFAEKNGFAEVACLPSFWGEGTEDAYLLQKQVE
ncbi:GNAT family N-acetyltransferase [Candidatus Thorarchaeota archaeon]|nr:MAG: GNAT family N-acetyltransferase [Candidatus Thorarchaeota archaeon]